MDKIAPLSFPKSTNDALKAFGPGLLYIAWVRVSPASRDKGSSRLILLSNKTTYKDAWTSIFAQGTYALRTCDSHGLPSVKCDVWATILLAVERELGEHRTHWFYSLSTLFFAKESLADGCRHRHPSGVTHCRHQFLEWKSEAVKLAKAIPPLSHFVTVVNSC